jgi:hypothetical protein
MSTRSASSTGRRGPRCVGGLAAGAAVAVLVTACGGSGAPPSGFGPAASSRRYQRRRPAVGRGDRAGRPVRRPAPGLRQPRPISHRPKSGRSHCVPRHHRRDQHRRIIGATSVGSRPSWPAADCPSCNAPSQIPLTDRNGVQRRARMGPRHGLGKPRRQVLVPLLARYAGQ